MSRISIFYCIFWLLNIILGVLEVGIGSAVEAGWVAIYLGCMGLLRETYYNDKEKDILETSFYDKDDFITLGKY